MDDGQGNRFRFTVPHAPPPPSARRWAGRPWLYLSLVKRLCNQNTATEQVTDLLGDVRWDRLMAGRPSLQTTDDPDAAWLAALTCDTATPSRTVSDTLEMLWPNRFGTFINDWIQLLFVLDTVSKPVFDAFLDYQRSAEPSERTFADPFDSEMLLFLVGRKRPCSSADTAPSEAPKKPKKNHVTRHTAKQLLNKTGVLQ